MPLSNRWIIAITLALAGCALCVSASDAPRTAAQVTPEQLRAATEKQYAALESLYLDLHRAPELSLMEENTSRRFAGELRTLGYDVTENVGGHGVVAILKNGDGKTLLIRTDVDALPVKEQTRADYASTVTVKNPDGQIVNVAHACGHDVHITCLVGVARAMSELKDRWHGTLVLIGQPAEEIGAGAKAMLQDGLFTRFGRPDFALAMHVDPELETGKIGYVSGYAMANVDSVDVVIRGVGAHGAHPHQGKDPIVIAAQTIMALQTIDSREIDPLEPVVVTDGSIHGGTKHNIIPDEVKLQLTVRTYKDDVREKTLRAIERIVTGTARAAGVPADREPIVTVRENEFAPALYNSPELVERVTSVLSTTLGSDRVVKREPMMAGEDFSRYGREEPKIPIFMFRLGCVAPARIAESKKPGAAPLPSLHSPLFLPERESIKTGVISMTAAALDLLK
jgi:hippurate hydrolase